MPNDGTNRMFILEQGGTIRIVQNGVIAPGSFLDLSSKVESGGEKGLLGLAFHPSFSTNGRFFVNYTRRLSNNNQLQTVIAEFTVSSTDPSRADASTERQLMVIDQPFDNHNGGQLAFGPDGFLYIGLGDGGGAGDPSGNAQNTNVLLGKILRIGVDQPFATGKQYATPSDNPFASGGGLPEVWAYGLRNPWRFSFDRATGRIFTGDVGQDTWEEVDIITKGGNFGWNIMEGNHCFPPGVASCNMTGLIPPITEYGRGSNGGISVIGGFVYNGTTMPDLVGAYVFGDLQSGHVWALKPDAAGNWQQILVLSHNRTISSFGQDFAGELYLVDYGGGAVLRIVQAP
jgi:glucose/arabinose dehydrogenase